MTGLFVIVVLIGAAAILVPTITGSTALTVMTSSMEPGIPAGTLVVVRPTDASDIAPGDVMTYQLRSGEPMLVTHRVTEQRRTADGGYLFATQGDANPTPDPGFVGEAQIRGTVWYAIPLVGWVSQVVTGEVRAIVVPLVASILGIYSVWMIVGGIRDRPRRGNGTDTDSAASLESDEEPMTSRRDRRHGAARKAS